MLIESDIIVEYKGLKLSGYRQFTKEEKKKLFSYFVRNMIFEVENYQYYEFYDYLKNIGKKLNKYDLFKIKNENSLNGMIICPTNYNFLFFMDNNDDEQYKLESIFKAKKLYEETCNKKENLIESTSKEIMIFYKKSLFEEEIKLDIINKKITYYLNKIKIKEYSYVTYKDLNNGIENLEMFNLEKIEEEFVKLLLEEKIILKDVQDENLIYEYTKLIYVYLARLKNISIDKDEIEETYIEFKNKTNMQIIKEILEDILYMIKRDIIRKLTD